MCAREKDREGELGGLVDKDSVFGAIVMWESL